MIVQLTVQNNISASFVLNSESATGRLLRPNQSIEATFELHEDPATGVATLYLYIDPAS